MASNLDAASSAAPRRGLAQYQQAAVAARDERALLREHFELVRRIAYHLAARLPDSVQIDDLIQAGTIGLLEASRTFVDREVAQFETYASIRIRGAMLDELRRSDWTPRSVHRNARRIRETIRVVEQREQRYATDAEVAAELGVDLAEYHRMLDDARGARLYALDELGGPDDDTDRWIAGEAPAPDEQFEAEEELEQLTESLAQLSDKEKLVLSLYYDESLNLKEIGAVLGVTESRVSQIRTQAILRLQRSVKRKNQ
ncbi:MAG: RNA polymerase sigma factor FliA [Thioalkalivibrionaceae bacterium]